MAQQPLRKRLAFALLVLASAILAVFLRQRVTHTRIDLRAQEERLLTALQALHDCIALHVIERTITCVDKANAALPEIINHCKKEVGTPLDAIQYAENGKIVDCWGRPLQIQISGGSKAAGGLRLRIWSLGRNGRDEQGKGDDVESQRAWRIESGGFVR